MGYGSTVFATGAEFDRWLEQEKSKKTGCFIAITRAFNAGEARLSLFALSACTPFDSLEGLNCIDWGDGTIDYTLNVLPSDNGLDYISHTYQEAGMYRVVLYGVTKINDGYQLLLQNANGQPPNPSMPPSIVVGGGVTSIGRGSLRYYSGYFENIIIEEGVREIGGSAFGVQKIKRISFPQTLESFSVGLFGAALNVFGLEELEIKAITPPAMTDISSTNYFVDLKRVIVPAVSLDAYKNHADYKAVFTDHGIPIVAYATDGEVKGTGSTLTVATSNWSSNAYTVTIDDLGENDAIFFTPQTREDKTAVEEANVFIETEGSAVTFTCESTPSADITFKYFICRGI